MRRAILSGTSLRSMATRPKPPLCNSKSVTRRACSTGPSIFLLETKALALREVFLAGLKPCLSRSCGARACPQRTQSNLSKATLAAAADWGSKAFVTSTRAHSSWRCVAAARAASNMLVRPEEAGPKISVRHPRGSPPVSASIAWIPVETISGTGRILSRDAAVTPLSLGSAERRLRRSAHLSSGAKTTGRFIAAWKQTRGEAIRPRNFRERRSRKASGESRVVSLFIRLRKFCSLTKNLSRL
jgi:hypothetical protein